MTSRRYLVLLIALSLSFILQAQPQFSGWAASFNTVRFNNKLSLHFDAQLRSTDELQAIQTILLRPGLNVHVNKAWTLSGGYAYIANRRTAGSLSALLPEHRIWQQALFSHKLSSIAVSHRIRVEERFISRTTLINDELEASGYDPAFRFWYFVRGLVPLTNHRAFTNGLFLALQNEVFLNTGDRSAVNGKTFDQNRLYGAVGYRFLRKIDLEAGYMNQYTATKAAFTNNHILQIALYKRL